MRRYIIFTISVILAACASPAPQRGPGGGPPVIGAAILKPGGLLFASFDRNGDYYIDSQEIGDGLATAEAAADADGSGAIAPFEYADWAKQALGGADALPGRLTLDVNVDNTITLDEFRDGFARLAREYADANGLIPFSALVRDLEAGRGGAQGQREYRRRSPSR